MWEDREVNVKISLLKTLIIRMDLWHQILQLKKNFQGCKKVMR
jgi:hypothetical protein